MNPQFRTKFLAKAKNNEKAVLAAFAESNKENALKTRPQVGIRVQLTSDYPLMIGRASTPNTATSSSSS